ncbi:metallophosphoesterase [Actinobacillus succinogenes]|uniref:Metallophosphoesterase n=1 Tax=Actinobacillus succinogenes (strain ATCC 55618 / DSM 22257 / CCUG 43843 / 130Z) TaxID=339671 RepID=A6VQ83_ACTSZ|nr:metallophosphoesterase [Actinobacillus succinogenes]ABR75130.1 metallophosphoesterase [Actinobacillus succinogenes 130Z]PHI40473.1 metallophosphoesterase [Actinobacillus succinogenes]
METRYYIIFAVIITALQFFLVLFHYTLRWLLQDKCNPKSLRWISVGFGIAANVFILSNIFFRLYQNFRLNALILVVLYFIALTGFVTFVIFHIGKIWFERKTLSRVLRILYVPALIGLFGLSLYNAYTPVVHHYQVRLNKPIQPLRIGVASDFHLGKYFGGKQMDKLAEIFRREKADLILLPGDIMDDNVDTYLAEKMQPHLAKLQAPLGVYATLGNHDLFGDELRIENEIRKTGIHLLKDEAVQVNGQFTVIGRNDDLMPNRPSAKTLLQGVNTDLPVFLMDHRPTDMLAHSQLPIDIQVSGHTHKGQIFPANLLIKMTYPLDYGFRQINNVNFFVTSGYGFWGVPMRLASQSEVFILEVRGTN